jgi:zinc transporter ZupT
VAHIVQLLENPFVAAALGLVLAFVLIRSSKASFRRIQPDDAVGGVAFAAGSLFIRLLVMTISLWAYKKFVPEGFKPFAFTFAGGFLVLYAYELARYAHPHKNRRPMDVSH